MTVDIELFLTRHPFLFAESTGFKLVAYAYRGKRLISKADFIDYLAATTDDETAWQRRQRERMSHDE